MGDYTMEVNLQEYGRLTKHAWYLKWVWLPSLRPLDSGKWDLKPWDPMGFQIKTK